MRIMGKVRKKELIRVEIDSFNKKGNGIGQIYKEGELVGTAEVPFAIPEDEVFARVIKKQKSCYPSKLEEVISPSLKRISPRCAHFGQCGGCRWQQVAYADQLHYKESYVKKCLNAYLTPEVDFRTIIPSVEEWRYRNKMEFSFSSDSQGNFYLGLAMDSGNGKIMDVTECHLVNPWFADALSAVRKWWKSSGLKAYHPRSDTGSLRNLTVREGKKTGDRLVMLTVSGNPDYALNKDQLEAFVAKVREVAEPYDPLRKLSIFLRIQQVAKGMSTNFYEMLLYGQDHIRELLEVKIDTNQPTQRLQFHVSPTAFFQPNSFQAEKLYSTALQMLEVTKGSVIYDLYCGTGTLGICAAKNAKLVVGIEVSPESALDAKANAALNGIENITILSGAVRHILKQIKDDPNIPKPDLVVVDPPRPGLDPEALEGLISLGADRILYLSCNPETLANDVGYLLKYGYRLRAVQPVDQFAQTPHVEVITILERESVNKMELNLWQN